MKTAVCIPDEVFHQAERAAKRLNKSRSELCAEALAEYLSKREPNVVTAAIDAVLDGEDRPQEVAFVRAAGRRTLRDTEW